VVIVVAVLIDVGMSGFSTQPQGLVFEPTRALAGIHPCDPADLGATASDAGAGGLFRGPGSVTFSCATLTVPMDHAGLRAAPPQPGQLSLQVAMADNTTAPRQPPMPFSARTTYSTSVFSRRYWQSSRSA
jgi:hypothetical protein